MRKRYVGINWPLFSFKKYWQEEQEKKKRERAAKKVILDKEKLEMAAGSIDDLFDEAEKVGKRKILRALHEDSDSEDELEAILNEEEGDNALEMRVNNDEEEEKRKEKVAKSEKKKEKRIDPDKFVERVKLSIPTMDEDNDDDEQDNEDFDEAKQADAIREAFEGDDVIADFK